MAVCQKMNFDTPLLLYDTFGNGNFIVAPDLRDGRPPEEAQPYRRILQGNILI